MYKLSIQIHTLLSGGKSPWYSKVHPICKQVTWSIGLCGVIVFQINPPTIEAL